MTQINHNVTSEIEKFEQLKEAWWNPDGELKTLHHINPARIQYIKQQTKLINQRVLDVGCGGGILSEALAKEGGIVTGIDQAGSAIDIAKNHAHAHDLNIDYLQTDIHDFAQTQNKLYDVIVCMELLEHIENPAALINTLSQLLKPNGKLFLSTLNRTTKAYLFGVVAAEYLLGLLPKGTHDYARFLKPAELSRWARDAGLSLLDLSGLDYNPWKKTAKITPAININYLMCLQKGC
ncbi:MAG: bifunctional 3-demethylubiquinol 3-O-methyltransferase/2-polyprenyl-6-hydroxyphenol methylase [Legionellales bacterium]|nr:bifunctional 3-demethylubiquinol 3-O-methyltransferase/2-polyprenyl-6-hydroxyphenol methylase [Legionellales bacterium]|tara:strand:- start:810 stop:1517 length:708 start_codon:yes stop_codon:yes gene_type:complete